MLRGLLLLLNMTGVPRLVMRLMVDRRVPLRLKLILPAALVYLISPLDLVPSILPGIDDVLVIIISLVMFLGMAPRDVVLEHLRNGRQPPDRPSDGPKSDGTVIEGKYRYVDDGEQAER